MAAVDTPRLVRFAAHGDPQTQGHYTPGQRKDGTLYVRPTSPKSLRFWRSEIAQAAKAAMGNSPPFEGPVLVDILFVLEDRTKANDPPPDSPAFQKWLSNRDVDTLSRAVLDGMTDAAVYFDDRQVFDLHSRKQWLGPGRRGPGIDVLVSEYNIL